MEQRRPLCAPDKTSRPAPPPILQNTITLIFASQSAVLINKVSFSPLPASTGPSPYTVPPARSPSSCSSSLFLHLQDESQRSQCHRTQTFTSPAPDISQSDTRSDIIGSSQINLCCSRGLSTPGGPLFDLAKSHPGIKPGILLLLGECVNQHLKK